MDFFGEQSRTRTSTHRLVGLFVLAVGLTNCAIYLAVATLLRLTHLLTALSRRSAPASGWWNRLANHFTAESIWNWELFGWMTLLVMTVVAIGSGAKFWQLRAGGTALATLLGGRRIDSATAEPDERRLLNVVEEMAIAAGLPVPEVYLLDEESGINAFAAGHEPADAVIGLTFGGLKLLDRDEVQGVIAHEFSHILNGDMRINIRLIGWLHGILGLVVLGRILTLSFLTRTYSDPIGSRGERIGPIFHPVFLPAFVLGCICIAVGSIGAFFARLVKSAVSRQREYLADAAAVQFTRNPAGIAAALKKIGGLRRHAMLTTARAEEASHMYFGDGMRPRWFGFTATHPPLEQRIKRIEPGFKGNYPAVSLERVLRESRVTALYRNHAGGKPVDFSKLAGVIGPAAAAEEMLYADAARRTPLPPPPVRTHFLRPLVPPAHLEYAALFLQNLPPALRAATQQPFSAVALIYALTCSNEPTVRATQIATLTAATDPGLPTELTRLLPMVDGLEASAFLPLATLSVRALRQLSAPQYETFRANLQQLVEADQQIDLFEYMLQRMVVRHLDPHFRPVKRTPVQYYRLKPLLPDCAILLSGLARIGQDNEADAEQAFATGASELPADAALTFLPLSACDLLQIDGAINNTAQATPPLKQQILNALTLTAATDGVLQRREAELLRAIADAFDLPIPPFLQPAETDDSSQG